MILSKLIKYKSIIGWMIVGISIVVSLANQSIVSDGENSVTGKSDNWAGACIDALEQRKILAASPNTDFSPSSPTTRAEFAVMLSRAFPNAKKTRSGITFRDMPNKYWAYREIQNAYQMGFFSGYSDQTFKPDSSITRSEALIALISGLKETGMISSSIKGEAFGWPDLSGPRYEDGTDIFPSHRSKLDMAGESRLVVSYPDAGVLHPNIPATKADVAAFLCQSMSETGTLMPFLVPSQYIVDGPTISDRKSNQESIERLTKSIQTNPNDAVAYYDRGLAFSDLGYDKQAIADYAQALSIDPDKTRRQWYSSPTRPSQDFIQILKAVPAKAEDYYERGVVRHYFGDDRGAYRDLTYAIWLNPKLASSYYMRGCSRNPINPRWDEAEADFTKAIQLNPHLTEAYYRRAFLKRFESRSEENVDYNSYLSTDLKSEPINSQVYYSSRLFEALGKFLIFVQKEYGKNFEETGKKFGDKGDDIYINDDLFRETMDDYTKVIHLDPLFESQEVKGIFIGCVDPQDNQKAIQTYTRLIQSNLTNKVDAYLGRGLAYYHIGETQSAINDFNYLTSLFKSNDPKVSDIYFYRGLARYKIRDFRGAISDYSQVIKLGSKDIDVYFARGLAKYDFGDANGAIKDFDRAEEIFKNTSFDRFDYKEYGIVLNSYIMKGHAYNDLGKKGEAKKLFKHFFSLNSAYYRPGSYSMHPASRLSGFIFYGTTGGGSSFRYSGGSRRSVDLRARRRRY